MSHDTTTINQTRQDLSTYEEFWLFAYGSLIYKVDFAYLTKSPGRINGWQRKFWQGSFDHRGTEDAPGRVVTLIPDEQHQCFGMAYQVDQTVFGQIDEREKNGYLRYEIEIHLQNGTVKQGLVYIAPEDNEAYLGPAPIELIVEQIKVSRGLSGENSEYALKLAQSLRQLDITDDHVFAVAQALL